MEPNGDTHLELAISGNSARVTVRPIGELVADSCAQLRHSLQDILARSPEEVAIDLSSVPFIDTSGIGVLVGLRKQFKSRSIAFSVHDPLPGVRDVLTRMKLDEVFGL